MRALSSVHTTRHLQTFECNTRQDNETNISQFGKRYSTLTITFLSLSCLTVPSNKINTQRQGRRDRKEWNDTQEGTAFVSTER